MSGTGWSLPLSSTCRNSCPLWGMTSCGMNQKDFLLLMCVGRCPFYLQEWGLWAPTQSGLVFTMHTLDPLIPGMCWVSLYALSPPPSSTWPSLFLCWYAAGESRRTGLAGPRQQFIISDFLWIFTITHCAFCHSLAIDPLTQSSIQ